MAPNNVPRPSDAEEHTECTPLLPGEREALRPERTRILIAICTLLIVLDIAGYLAIAPQTKIFQDIICAKYYNETITSFQMDDKRCKIEPVQSEIALLNGWKDTLDQLPGIVFAVPWGIAADKFGRKPVLLLGMFGYTLADFWVKIICRF
jgi:MFS family permease